MKEKLGNIATYINGYPFQPSDWADEGKPIIRIQDLTGTSYQTNRYSGNIDKKYFVKKGDILISWSASLGVYVWEGEDALLNQHIFKVVFNKIEVDKMYFVYQLSYLLKRFAHEAHGATMKHLTKPIFDSIPFSLPSLDKQQQIARFFNKAESLICNRKRQLEKLDLLVKAKFYEMFGDPVKSPKYSLIPIERLGDVMTGTTPSMKENKYYDSNDIMFIKPGDIAEEQITTITSSKTYLSENARLVGRIFPEKSVLVTCIGTIGKVGISTMESSCNQQINVIVPYKQVNYLYLAHTLLYIKRRLIEVANAPVVPILNKSDFSKIALPLPPLPLQEQFAHFVEQTDKIKAKIKPSLEKLELLKQSLLQKYFG